MGGLLEDMTLSDWAPYAISGLVVVLITAVAAAIRSFGGEKDEVMDRLERVANRDTAGLQAGRDQEASPATQMFGRIFSPLTRLIQPARSEETSRLRRSLVQAGYRNPFAIEVFVGLKLLAAPVLAIVFLQVNLRLPSPLQPPVDVAVAVWLCAVGFWMPNVFLRGKMRDRQISIERALPDAMDLLVTCVEAGLGLDAALHRVADEVSLASVILGDELELTFLEIQAGMPRADAFRRLADRTGLEELKSLSAMLIQTEMFGTSVARALRIHSEGMRIKRMQRAEERAATVAVKLTVPLVLCILPSLIAVIMGPAVVAISKAFLKQ